MNQLEERQVECPYCGETLDVLIDSSIEHQNYIEDCQVCCRPINFDVILNHTGEISLTVSQEDD